MIIQVEWTWHRKGESHQCNKSTKMNPSGGKEAGPALRQAPQPAMRLLANDRPEDIILAQITSHASPLLAPPTEQRWSGIPRHAIYHSTFWTSQGHHPAPRPCGGSPAACGACRKYTLEVLSPCVNGNHNHWPSKRAAKGSGTVPVCPCVPFSFLLLSSLLFPSLPSFKKKVLF